MTTIFFERAWALIAIAPVAIIILMLTFRNVLRFHDDFERRTYTKKRRGRRILLAFTRIIIVSAVLVALAGPTTVDERRTQGDMHLKIFVDDSRSMELFDRSVAERLKGALGTSFPVTVVGTSEIDSSGIGDFLVRNMEQNDNVLLISDGQVTKGKQLADVLLLAHKLNASINTLQMSQQKADAWVTVSAPELSSSGTDTPVLVSVHQSGIIPSVKLTVTLDGAEWTSQQVIFNSNGDFELPLTRNLPQGQHQVVARLEASDHFSQNNIFRTVIKVEPKPRVLLLTTSSNPPLVNLLNKVFDITSASSLPSDMAPYSTIIIDNMQAKDLPPLDRITRFVTDGRGMFVVGGPSSLDRGGYKGTQFENLLPVSVGIPKKDQNQSPVIVFVIDISGSSGAQFSTSSERIVGDVQEDIAISILRGLKNDTKVGVVAFNTVPYVVAEIQEKGKQPDLEEKIVMLNTFGGTLIDEGLRKALYLVSREPGSKSVILISDGQTQLAGDARAMAMGMTSNGIRLYTVGVGEGTNEDFMKLLANLGKGSYFRPKETDRVQIVLGAPQDNNKNNTNSLQIVDFNDFITKDLLLQGRVSGFNSVIPKSSGKLLVTLTDGRPILTTWRFGLGRVAVLSTDDGSGWAGALLNNQNAPLISKTVFWTVGDPRESKQFDVLTTHGVVGEPLTIAVKSGGLPDEKGLSFSKTDENIYTTTLSTKEPSFVKVLGHNIAINYPIELSKLGVSPDFVNLIQQSGGTTFSESDIGAIKKAVQEHSVRTEVSTVSWAWVPLSLALVLFLLEVIIRRVADSRHA